MKKRNLLSLCFLALFSLLCLVPLAGLAVTGPAGAAANEHLAAWPRPTTAEGKWNLNYLTGLSDWFADHFAFRQELVTVNAALEARLLGESAEEKVVLGKEGWLYYASSLDDYQGCHLLTERQIWAAAHTLRMIQTDCEGRGATFLFTVAPNKNTLYPAYMPSKYGGLSDESSLLALAAALEREGVSYLDLVSLLGKEDRVLYHRLDSHWTGLGAALARDGIMTALGRASESFYDPARFETRRDFAGDLYAMLYPAGKELDEESYPVWAYTYEYTSRYRSPEELYFTTACAGREGNLFLYRDSFGNALHPFLAESFGTCAFSRAMPYDLRQIPAETDAVVIEIVQRNLSRLCTEAPVIAAPLAELTVPRAETEISAQVHREESGDGYLFTGQIYAAVDTDSPVYLLVDGAVYEACPVGVGETPFTAYLPAPGSRVRLLFRQNGTLLMSRELDCN